MRGGLGELLVTTNYKFAVTGVRFLLDIGKYLNHAVFWGKLFIDAIGENGLSFVLVI